MAQEGRTVVLPSSPVKLCREGVDESVRLIRLE